MFKLIFPLFLFFIDFVFFNILQKWTLCFLLAYFIITLFEEEQGFIYGFGFFYFPLFLFLLQDNFINGRLGLCLIYVVPMIIFTVKTRNWFDSAKKYIYLLFMVFALFFQDFLIKSWVLGQNIEVNSTMYKIFINIIVVYLVFLGMRGSRSLLEIRA